VLVQPKADLGGLQPPRGTAQQLLVQRLFQLRKVVADVGTAHLEPAGGHAKVAGFHDIGQQHQILCIHAYIRRISLTVYYTFRELYEYIDGCIMPSLHSGSSPWHSTPKPSACCRPPFSASFKSGSCPPKTTSKNTMKCLKTLSTT